VTKFNARIISKKLFKRLNPDAEEVEETSEAKPVGKRKEETKNVTSIKPFQIAFRSDVGMHRDLDEDSVVVIDFGSAYGSSAFKRVFAVVADGMGGTNRGEIASYLAAKNIAEHVCLLLIGKETEEINYAPKLKEGYLKAHAAILSQAGTSSEFRGMGTTASSVIINGSQLVVAHVGDSRVYLINDGKIEQLTKDHSYVQELVDSGRISSEQARNHPRKNEITRALGYGSDLEIDLFEGSLHNGDYVLLCCDGLVNELTDDEVLQKVLTADNLDSACNDLIDSANKKGGRDNISVIIIGPFAFTEPKVPKEQVLNDQGEPDPNSITANSEPTATSTSNLYWCENCGHPINLKKETCPYCGAKIVTTSISSKI
jgi:serine/threonine protein phosphatase PrpC